VCVCEREREREREREKMPSNVTVCPRNISYKTCVFSGLLLRVTST